MKKIEWAGELKEDSSTVKVQENEKIYSEDRQGLWKRTCFQIYFHTLRRSDTFLILLLSCNVIKTKIPIFMRPNSARDLSVPAVCRYSEAGTSCRYPVTRLIFTTSCEPHSGQTGWPQSGQYSIPDMISWLQWQWSSGHISSRCVSPQLGQGFSSTIRWQVWHLYLRSFSGISSSSFDIYSAIFLLFRCPIHSISLHRSLINI